MSQTLTTTREAAQEIADLLLKTGKLTQKELDHALRIQSKLAQSRPLVSILKELNLINDEELQATLREHRLDIRLGTLLLELGFISESDLQSAVGLWSDSAGKLLGQVLVENNFLTEDELLKVLSAQMGVPYFDQDKLPANRDLTTKVRPGWLEKNLCFPLPHPEGGICLAIIDPTNTSAFEEAEKFFGQKIRPALARSHAIRLAIRSLSDSRKTSRPATAESEVVKAVNDLLDEAIQNGASDIHIEPMKNRLRVRCRQDGVLIHNQDFPTEMARPLTSRIKIMAGADIAERRRHQDGRMLYECGGAKIDLRVSFYSTIHGEKIVLRLLNNRSNLLDINELGMAPRMLDRFRNDVLDVPSGVVLVTGPTGSGKTTTLYGAINYLNNINTSIITAEDPVEYVIPGINQCSINPKIAITYEETLRHIVRQDPDVIVIGEIRDRFSADTAIQAALTGHKVLTTFHTEDSIGGLLRLLHMDIEAFLISSTVVSVVAQRLVRRVCPHCAEEHVLTPDELRRLGFNPKDVSRLAFGRGHGCRECHFVGYKGRIAIFELLILNEKVKEALIDRRTSYEIRRISTESTGLVSLLEDGIAKAGEGLTSFEEIIRTLPRLARPRPISELHRLRGGKS
jgi:type IV pilus assembly protein PilB